MVMLMVDSAPTAKKMAASVLVPVVFPPTALMLMRARATDLATVTTVEKAKARVTDLVMVPTAAKASARVKKAPVLVLVTVGEKD